MVLVADQFKVLVSEIEQGLDIRIEAHLWWGIGVRDSWISACFRLKPIIFIPIVSLCDGEKFVRPFSPSFFTVRRGL